MTERAISKDNRVRYDRAEASLVIFVLIMRNQHITRRIRIYRTNTTFWPVDCAWFACASYFACRNNVRAARQERLPSVIFLVFESAPPCSAHAGHPPAEIIPLRSPSCPERPRKMSIVQHCARDTCCTAKSLTYLPNICMIHTSTFQNLGFFDWLACHWLLSTIDLSSIVNIEPVVSDFYCACHEQRNIWKEFRKLYQILAFCVLGEDMTGTEKKLVKPNQECPNKFVKLWPNIRK